jgi:hypothetical protein
MQSVKNKTDGTPKTSHTFEMLPRHVLAIKSNQWAKNTKTASIKWGNNTITPFFNKRP